MANEKILVIDDDPDLVEVIRLTLEASGEDGLQKVQDVHPDLIVLDVMMDYTTEGFQVSLALRSPDPQSEYAAYRGIPILMLTAIHSTTPLRFGPEQDYLPVDDFVEKPIEPSALVAKIRGLLDKANAG
jgi:two-component system alkaline phosphatase synthesis response regulator PhoP